MTPSTLLFAALIAQSPASVRPVQSWNARTVASHFNTIELAARSSDAAARDTVLLTAAGQAYKTVRKPGESNEEFARRTIKKLDSLHPKVKKGQWLLALIYRFYSDLAQRSKTLSRFERRKKDRQYFEQQANTYEGYAQTISDLIRIKVKGLDAEIEMLPKAKGSTKKVHGIPVTVIGENISIDQFKRVTFSGHQPAEDANRTAKGSLMSLFNSFRQKQVFAKLMARSGRRKDKSIGKTQLYLPANKPAVYYNEILRAAKEAKLHTAYLMVFKEKSGELAHLKIRLKRPRSKKARRKVEAARCLDKERVQACVDRLSDLSKKGAILLYQ